MPKRYSRRFAPVWIRRTRDPVEALAHARYLQQRGMGLQSLIGIYKHGFSMFRELLAVELRERSADAAQAARLLAAADAYSFRSSLARVEQIKSFHLLDHECLSAGDSSPRR
jgi:hypothetical protein